MITHGFEFVTAITNLLILLVCLFAFFFMKNSPKIWKAFYFLFLIDSFFGIIIHGFVISPFTKKLLWLFLCGFFTFTINLLLYIFNRKLFNLKRYLLLSIFIYLIFLILMIFNIDFLPYFIFYAGLSIILLLIFMFKNFKKNMYYIIGLLLQFISGIFLIFKYKIFIFDKNAISHFLLIITLIFFMIGSKKEFK